MRKYEKPAGTASSLEEYVGQAYDKCIADCDTLYVAGGIANGLCHTGCRVFYKKPK